MGFVDLHLHLLPGVDDGPATLTDSLVHADKLVRRGVHDAVATPHVGHPDFPVDITELPRRTEQLRRALAVAGIHLRLRTGGEIHAGGVDLMTRDELEVVALGPPGARWVLLEAPFRGMGDRFLGSVLHLRRRGFGVVVAHPERSASDLAAARRVASAGALLQVNTCSLLGVHGADAREKAIRLILDGSAYVIASDGHGGRRSQTLRAGRDLAIEAGAAPERAAQLTQANPRFLLEHGMPSFSPSAAPPAGRPAS